MIAGENPRSGTRVPAKPVRSTASRAARNATTHGHLLANAGRDYLVSRLGRAAAWQRRQRPDYGAVVMRGVAASILPELARLS